MLPPGQVTPGGAWLWTPAEVAVFTHFSESKIRADIRRGKLHVYKPGGSDARVPRPSVDDYILDVDCDCDGCTAKRAAWEANGHV
jgi:excisionase family DNA binding protein